LGKNIYGIKLTEIKQDEILIEVFYKNKLDENTFLKIINEIRYRFDM